MKILHLIYDDPENSWCGGGGAVRVREINKRLSAGHTIVMLTGNHPSLKNEQFGGLKIIRIGSCANYLFSRITYAFAAYIWIRKYKPDIIVNDFSVFSPVFCEFVSRKKVINSFYHFIGGHAFKKYNIFGVIPFFAEKLLLKISRYFITISPSVTAILKQKIKNGRMVKCIYTGIHDGLFDSHPVEGDYIAYIGRIDIYMKGLDTLLQAYAKTNRNLKLKIAGIGKEKDILELKKMISQLAIEQCVEFLGTLSEEEKKEYIEKSLFVVMPSRFEGWGIAAIEAQACGKAVIGTDIPGLKDAIRNNETGMLVESENTDKLAGAINTLIENPSLRREFQENGKKWAQNFKWDNIAADQLAYYKSILHSQE